MKSVPRCKHPAKTGHKFCPECGQSSAPLPIDDAISMYIALEKTTNEEFCFGIDHKGESTDACTWYKFSDDIAKLSLKFPDVLFILSGEGEESGDIWRAYYRNGYEQKVEARLIFDPFDPHKMTRICK